jgi:hypothetical protein
VSFAPLPGRYCTQKTSWVAERDCFISSIEHVIPWVGVHHSRQVHLAPGPNCFAVCWCSELARVGVDLDRGRLLTRYLGRAGCLSTPTGMDQAGSPKSGRIRAWGRVGSDLRQRTCTQQSTPGSLSKSTQRVSQVLHVTRLSRAPWLCPIGSVALGAVPVVDFINCPDAVRATRFTKPAILDQNSH